MKYKVYIGFLLIVFLGAVIYFIPKNSTDTLARCQSLFSKGEFEACQQELQRFLTKDPNNHDARVLLIKAQLAQELLEPAIENMVLLPATDTRKQQLADSLLTKVTASNSQGIYKRLEAIETADDHNYQWSREMLVKIAVKIEDNESLLYYAGQAKGMLTTSLINQVWEYALSTDNHEFICSMTKVLNYETKLIEIIDNLSDEQFAEWLPYLEQMTYSPDFALRVAQLCGIHKIVAARGLNILITLEDLNTLPTDRKEFSRVKYHLLGRHSKTVTKDDLTNLTLMDMAYLAATKQSLGDQASYINILNVIEASGSQQLPLVKGILFPPKPLASKVVVNAGQDSYYDYVSISPDSSNLLWVDWNQNTSLWWNATSKKVTNLNMLLNATCWSPEGNYVALWTTDRPQKVHLFRTANMVQIAELLWNGTVLGWVNDQFYTISADKNTLYHYSVSSERAASTDIPTGYTPLLSPDGEVKYIKVTSSSIIVLTEEGERVFSNPEGLNIRILILADNRGLLLYSKESGRYYILGYTSGEAQEIEALGASFQPLFDHYLWPMYQNYQWDGRNLWGYQAKQTLIDSENHLFRYDLLSSSLTHSGITHSLSEEMVSVSGLRAALIKRDIVIYNLR